MKVILKPVFEWIIDQYMLFENPIYNYLVMGIIGIIGFSIAFRFVGDLYRMDLIEGRTAGSIIHWIVRLIVVTVLFLLVGGIIWVVRFIISLPWWVWLIAGGLLLLAIIMLIILRKIRKRSTNENT